VRRKENEYASYFKESSEGYFKRHTALLRFMDAGDEIKSPR